MSILQLPVDIRYNILAFLPLPDLLNFCCINKESVKIINSNKFWLHKLVLQFPDYVKAQPTSDSKQWYQKIYESGDAFMNQDGQIKHIAKDVTKYFHVAEDTYFYIDIYDTLYFMSGGFRVCNSTIPRPWEKLISKCKREKYWNPIRLQENVADFYIGVGLTVVLSTDGILYTLGYGADETEKEFFKLASGIKKIINNTANICLILDREDTLFWLRTNRMEKIVENVMTCAVDMLNDVEILYYVTKKNELWEYYPEKVFERKKLTTPGDIPKEKVLINYVHRRIFEENVKDVASTECHLIFLDINGRVYIYHKRHFSSEYYDYDERDEENTELAGFNQDHFSKFKFVQIVNSFDYRSLILLDNHHNLYNLDHRLFHDKLKPFKRNVARVFMGDPLCYIERRLPNFKDSEKDLEESKEESDEDLEESERIRVVESDEEYI